MDELTDQDTTMELCDFTVIKNELSKPLDAQQLRQYVATHTEFKELLTKFYGVASQVYMDEQAAGIADEQHCHDELFISADHLQEKKTEAKLITTQFTSHISLANSDGAGDAESAFLDGAALSRTPTPQIV